MDTLYSVSLMLSLIAGGVGVVFASLILIGRRLRRVKSSEYQSFLFSRLKRIAWWLVLFALAALLISLLIHRVWGHGHGSIEAMDSVTFLKAHPAFFVAAGLIILSAVLLRLSDKVSAAQKRNLNMRTIKHIAQRDVQ